MSDICSINALKDLKEAFQPGIEPTQEALLPTPGIRPMPEHPSGAVINVSKLSSRHVLQAAIHSTFLDEDMCARELAAVKLIIDHAGPCLSASELDAMLFEAAAFYLALGKQTIMECGP